MKSKLYILTVLIFVLSICQTIGQTIKGKVIDKSNGLALAYTNIYLSTDTSIGTISNKNGLFEFKIPENINNGTLVFSSLGYETQNINLGDTNPETELIIKLNPKALKLDEVVLLSKDVKPAKILRKAISRVYRNYPKQPYQSTFFYRQSDFKGNLLSRVVEAEILVDDQGYLSTYDDLKVYLSEMRKTNDLGETNPNAIFLQGMTAQMGSPKMAFNFDHVRNAYQSVSGFALKPRLLQNDSLFNPFKHFDMEIEKAVLNKDDEIVYVLHLSHLTEKIDPKQDSGKVVNTKKFRRDLNRYSNLPKELKQAIIDQEKQQDADGVKRVSGGGLRKNITQFEYHYRLYIDAKDFGIYKIVSEMNVREYTDEENFTIRPFSSSNVIYKKTDKYRLSSLTATIVDAQKGSASDGQRQYKKYELLNKQPIDKPLNDLLYIAPQTNLFQIEQPYNHSFWLQTNKIKNTDFKISFEGSMFGSEDLEKYFIKN